MHASYAWFSSYTSNTPHSFISCKTCTQLSSTPTPNIYQSPISRVTLENSPNGFGSRSYTFPPAEAAPPPDPPDRPVPGVPSPWAVSSFGVSIPGVEAPPKADGDPACAWMISPPTAAGLRSKSNDLESRIVRKLIASTPFDSAGMILS